MNRPHVRSQTAFSGLACINQSTLYMSSLQCFFIALCQRGHTVVEQQPVSYLVSQQVSSVRSVSQTASHPQQSVSQPASQPQQSVSQPAGCPQQSVSHVIRVNRLKYVKKKPYKELPLSKIIHLQTE